MRFAGEMGSVDMINEGYPVSKDTRTVKTKKIPFQEMAVLLCEMETV
jgi:hypothetical protein